MEKDNKKYVVCTKNKENKIIISSIRLSAADATELKNKLNAAGNRIYFVKKTD